MGLSFTKEDYVNKIKNDIVLRNTQVIRQVYDSTTIVTNTLVNKVNNEVTSNNTASNVSIITGSIFKGNAKFILNQSATLNATIDAMITMATDANIQNQILSNARQGVSNLLTSDVGFKNDMAILKKVDETKTVSGEFNNIVDGLVTVGSKLVENMVPHANVSMKSYKNETVNNYLTENNLNETIDTQNDKNVFNCMIIDLINKLS
jgi:hypothetical protein